MKKTKTFIIYKKERVVFSDTLPYETPIIFSNRHLYDFLLNHGIAMEDNIISWKHDNDVLENVIKLLFDFKIPVTNPTPTSIEFDKKKQLKTIPFIFKISHKENDFRQLAVIHPKSQLMVVEFYERFKHLILYYSTIGPFSIRKPHKIAKFIIYNDKTNKEKLAHNSAHESIEQAGTTYANLKTFFTYKSYSNIHKFYESYEYHRCEKKYNKMFKIDIASCFDSIYTHSLAWALLNKNLVKDKINEVDKTFGGVFDKLMQSVNYGETNGIIIGPEFSRIFAELLLQQIDKSVFKTLRGKEIIHKVDYEIFRYVDDFFIFYNSDNTKDSIVETYRLHLKEFKLHINENKSKLYDKPIITEITIAKQRISDLLNKYLSFKLDENEIVDEDESTKLEIKHNIYASSNRIITQFKTVIKETSIEYKDILNYALASIDKKVAKLIEKYELIQEKRKIQKKVVQTILEILDFTFFIYAVSPRVNSTIKLCMILSKLIVFIKKKENFNFDEKHLIFKKIYDDIYFILNKNKSNPYTQAETLYLLIILQELGKEYRLDSNILCLYFGIDTKNSFKFEHTLNYFSIVVLLFYVKNIKRYDNVKIELKAHIMIKFNSISAENLSKSTELILLLFDILSCPYLDKEFKKTLLQKYGVQNTVTDGSDNLLQERIIEFKKFWFVQWTDFDLIKALAAKKSQEVYG